MRDTRSSTRAERGMSGSRNGKRFVSVFCALNGIAVEKARMEKVSIERIGFTWMSLMTNVYPGVNKTSPEILPMSLLRALLWTVLFAVAFAWVEASVVVYLRDIYYPQGFSFPIQSLSVSRIPIELVRECSTLVMLAAIGILAGTTRWQRFAYFAVAFGVWDIFF